LRERKAPRPLSATNGHDFAWNIGLRVELTYRAEAMIAVRDHKPPMPKIAHDQQRWQPRALSNRFPLGAIVEGVGRVVRRAHKVWCNLVVESGFA